MSKEWIAIIGASSDLGMESIRSLIAGNNDIHFFCHFRNSSVAFKELQDRLGHRMISAQADLTNPESVKLLAEKILASCGAPRAFLYLASPALKVRRFKEIPLEDFAENFAVQTTAPAALLSKIIPAMLKAKTTSSIVLMLSEVVRGAAPKGMADYVAGKFSQLGLLRALQAEFGGGTIAIHGLAPGMIETKFLKHVPELAVEAARQSSPNGKLKSTAEVAELIRAAIYTPEKLIGNPAYLD